MPTSSNPRPPNPLATLQRFVRKPAAIAERCELCAKPLTSLHQHLLELEKRRVACACDACAILFPGSSQQRFKRVPRDTTRLHDFAMDDHEWESLLIPIDLAYFVESSATGRVVAQYPSPGGAMESSLDFEYWNAIVARNPVLKQFEPDVEALLVNRVGGTRESYRVGIDECYRLVGLIRTRWRGLSGGQDVWQEIGRLFAGLRERSR
jgi:hypothetical protein